MPTAKINIVLRPKQWKQIAINEKRSESLNPNNWLKIYNKLVNIFSSLSLILMYLSKFFASRLVNNHLCLNAPQRIL